MLWLGSRVSVRWEFPIPIGVGSPTDRYGVWYGAFFFLVLCPNGYVPLAQVFKKREVDTYIMTYIPM